MNKIKVISIIIAMVGVSVCYFLTRPYFQLGGKFDNGYDCEDLKSNLSENKRELIELKKYFLEILPPGKGVSFGYNNRHDQFYFILREIKSNYDIKYTTLENSKIDSKEMVDILDQTGWTIEQLKELQLKLEASNCIGIFKQPYKEKPVQISFRNGGPLGLGKYSYILFSPPLPDSLLDNWALKEGISIFNNEILLESGMPL